MSCLTDPFFWALLALLGIHGANLVVSDHPLGRSLPFVALALTLVTLGRLLLCLPFCPQPRFDLGAWNWIAGGGVLLLALVIALPTLSILWWRAPEAGMRLRTRGAYSIVRHPMYAAELLWPVGWSLCWGSVWGLALTPLWWSAFLVHVLAEEASLLRELGPEYEQYMARVKGRMLPGLPF